MNSALRLLEWLAARAAASLGADAGSAPWAAPSTADRAGRLVAVPEDAAQPEVGRSLGPWWLWLAVGLVLLMLVGGYVRRRWRGKGAPARPAWLTWRARR